MYCLFFTYVLQELYNMSNGHVAAFIQTWETWKKSSIHLVCPSGQVRVKVLSPNPQLLCVGQVLAKPRGVVPMKNNLRLLIYED